MANDFNDILVLFVNNITNSDYTYGMLTKSDIRGGTTSISATYRVMRDGVVNTYSISGRSFSAYSGNPVALRLSGGKLDHMFALTAITTGARVDKVEPGRIKLKSGSVYTMADDVQIFKYVSAANYTQLSLAELAETDKSVSLYAERSVQNGGIIRVIVVR